MYVLIYLNVHVCCFSSKVFRIERNFQNQFILLVYTLILVHENLDVLPNFPSNHKNGPEIQIEQTLLAVLSLDFLYFFCGQRSPCHQDLLSSLWSKHKIHLICIYCCWFLWSISPWIQHYCWSLCSISPFRHRSRNLCLGGGVYW